MRLAGTRWTLCGLLGAAALPAFARLLEVPASEGGVSVSSPRVRDEKCTWGPHTGHDITAHDVSLATGRADYTLRWTACVDKAHGERTSWIEGYLGMPGPSSANWYHSGFLFLYVNGEDAGTYRPVYFGPSEAGQRGALDIIWSLPSGPVRVRFVALPNEDALLMEVRLELKEPATGLALRLNCYPGTFTSWLKIKGDRTITTAGREEHQNPWDPKAEQPPTQRTVALDPKQDWWIFYSDSVCDVARGVGDGPCAMLFLPEQMTKVEVTLTDYPIGTSLTADPTIRSLRMIFSDFRGQKNAEALRYLKDNAERYRQLLEKTDFGNTSIANLLAGKTDLEVARLMKSGTDLGDLRPAVEAFLDQFSKAAAKAEEARKATGQVPILDEKAILSLLQKQEEIADPIRWKALFAD